MNKITEIKQRKKKNKGITLISLIITMIVLLILAGVSIATLTGENGILNKASKVGEKTVEAQIKEEIELTIIEIQAEEISEGRVVTLETLANGQLTNKLQNITATLEENEIIGEYKGYEYIIDDTFKATIGEKVKGISITYELSNLKYTNQDITLTIHATSTNGEITKIEGPTQLIKNDDNTYRITQNGKYEFIVTDSTEQTKAKTIVISNIDKLAPKDFTPEIKNIMTDEFTIISNAEDEESNHENAKSDIQKYEYYKKDSASSEYIKYESLEGNFTINGLQPSTTYSIYVIVYDKAGNSKVSNTLEITTLQNPFPPNATISFNENNATVTALEFPILTLDGVMNCSLEPNIGEKVTLEITSPPKEGMIYYYFLDGGSTWNEYINKIDTNYVGKDQIQVKAVYKNLHSQIANIKKYLYDSSQKCTGTKALDSSVYDNSFETFINYSGNEQTGIFLIDHNCWGKYLTIYCYSAEDYGYINFSSNQTDINSQGSFLNRFGEPTTRLSCKSLIIPTYMNSILLGTGGRNANISLYEVWCSEENLAGTVY